MLSCILAKTLVWHKLIDSVHCKFISILSMLGQCRSHGGVPMLMERTCTTVEILEQFDLDVCQVGVSLRAAHSKGFSLAHYVFETPGGRSDFARSFLGARWSVLGQILAPSRTRQRLLVGPLRV
jgi:hypothetical protein